MVGEPELEAAHLRLQTIYSLLHVVSCVRATRVLVCDDVLHCLDSDVTRSLSEFERLH